MSEKDMLALIERYLETVERLSTALAAAYQVDSLLVARKSKKIPRLGDFGSCGEFSFHGIGCRIDDGNTSADFDFYGDGRTDGFDAWRLRGFVEHNKLAADLAFDTSHNALKSKIAELVLSGSVVPIAGSNLFRLVPQPVRAAPKGSPP